MTSIIRFLFWGVLLVSSLFIPAFADNSFQVGVGVGATTLKYSHHSQPAYFLAWQPAGYGWKPRVQIGKIQSNGSYVRSTQYVSFSLIDNGHHFFVGGGVVRVSRQTYELSAPYQFILTGGIHLARHIDLMLQHVSDASTGGENRGINMVSFAWKF